MKTFSATMPDKTSDPVEQLQVELRKLELTHIPEMGTQLTQARTNLLTTIPTYVRSRFDFGRVLYGYKRQFKAAGGWLAAAAAIGKAIGRDGKTVLRIVSHYEEVMGLDPMFAELLAEELVDPGAPKNTAIVQQLIEMPAPASREEAAAAVAAIVRERRALKKSAHSKRQKEEQPEQHEQTQENDTAADQEGAEGFSDRIVQIFQRRYAQASTDQGKAEIEQTLIAVGRAFGVYLVRRTLLPPKDGQHSQAA